jgi:mannose-1-phosphate guanylyltransferase
VTLPALVLTAGLGTRLDPLTRLVAKPAVPLGDSTLIEHVLAWLRREGVTDVVLNLHHRPASLTGIVGDGRHLGLSARYSWEQPLLGSAGGPRRALPLVGADTFLVVNGDTLCDFAIAPLIDAHARSGAEVTLAVVPNPAPDRYNGITIDAAGAVTGFVPRGPAAAGTWHLVGVQVVSARAFAPLPDGVPAESVAGLYRDMLRDAPGRIRVHPVATPFLDVGTTADYLDAAIGMAGGVAASRVPPSAHLTRTIVWPAATIGEGVRLDRAIVAGAARVPAGFTAASVVVVPADVVRPGDAAEIRGTVALFAIEARP